MEFIGSHYKKRKEDVEQVMSFVGSSDITSARFAGNTKRLYLEHLEQFIKFSGKLPESCDYDDVRNFLLNAIRVRLAEKNPRQTAATEIMYFFSLNGRISRLGRLIASSGAIVRKFFDMEQQVYVHGTQNQRNTTKQDESLHFVTCGFELVHNPACKQNDRIYDHAAEDVPQNEKSRTTFFRNAFDVHPYHLLRQLRCAALSTVLKQFGRPNDATGCRTSERFWRCPER